VIVTPKQWAVDLIEEARQAVEAVYNEETLSVADTIDALEPLSNELQGMIGTLKWPNPINDPRVTIPMKDAPKSPKRKPSKKAVQGKAPKRRSP
jgi:hypothetical protein